MKHTPSNSEKETLSLNPHLNGIKILRCRHNCTASSIARSSKTIICRARDAVVENTNFEN